MFSAFEKFFNVVSSLGTATFTSICLISQVVIFFLLLILHFYKTRNERATMKNIKEVIGPMERTSKDNFVEIDQKINGFFQSQKDSSYKTLWKRYHDRASEKAEDERINVEPFFGFEVMNYHLGNRGLMDVGSGLHVSLGVLGTFLGLSVGLADLQIEDTDTLRNGIGSLLNGMKVAFYTSVLGVFLSIIWTFIDRFISSDIEEKIDWHSEKLNYLLSTDDEELFLSRLEKVSKNQADHLKTLLTDALEKAMQPMVSTMQQSNGVISTAFGQLSDQFSQLQSGIDNQSKLLETQVELTKSTSSDMTEKMIDQITGGTEQSINHFTDMVKQSQVLQSEMMGTVQQVVSSFVDTQTRQSSTMEKTEKIAEHFEMMVSEMDQMRGSYQETAAFMNNLGTIFENIQSLTAEQLPVQQEMMRSNQALADKYDGLTEGFNRFKIQAEEQYSQLLNQVMTVSSSMTRSFQTMTSAFESSLQTQQKTLLDSEKLLGSVQESASTLAPIAEEFSRSINHVNSLQEQLTKMQDLQSDLLPELVKLREQTSEAATDALEKTKTYMQNMTEQLNIMGENWQTTKEQFSNTTEALRISMKDFEANIEKGLSKTYQHFDETLVNAVSSVSNLINQFSEDQEEFIEQFEEFTDLIGRLKAGSVS